MPHGARDALPHVVPSFLSKTDAAIYTSFSVATLDRFIADGLLPAYRVGDRGHYRIKVTDLDALLMKEAG